MKKRVLDACCGSRMFWFDKENPDVEYCDIRTVNDTLCDGRSIEILPDTVADFTKLPFENDTFWHVVFDPPHLMSLGTNSWMAKKIRRSAKRELGKNIARWLCRMHARFKTKRHIDI